jgi:translation initiation factor eIF-2B subunit epsilon
MSKKKERGNDDDVKREKPLQAVLLADSFTTTFRPVSLELPKVLVFDFDWMHALASILQDIAVSTLSPARSNKVLFPLGSAPMLAYSLELLASNDVKQVFVFCCAHAEAIKTYIERSGSNFEHYFQTSHYHHESYFRLVEQIEY